MRWNSRGDGRRVRLDSSIENAGRSSLGLALDGRGMNLGRSGLD